MTAEQRKQLEEKAGTYCESVGTNDESYYRGSLGAGFIAGAEAGFELATQGKAADISQCGLCLPEKPCNQERCPNDTVLAADYNKLLLRLREVENALEEKCEWQASMLERGKRFIERAAPMHTPENIWLSDLAKGQSND